MSRNSRAIAAQVIGELLNGRGSLSTQLEAHRNLTEFQLIQEFCFGSCRWFHQLDFLLQQLLTRPLKKKDRDLHALLLIGLYQLRHMRVPDHASINETVAAVTDLNKLWAKGLVNAVLRNYQRQQDELQAALNDAGPAQRYSHPQWLVDALSDAWPDRAEEVLTANNQKPPLTLRVNLARQSREQYLEKLIAAGIEARPGTLAASAVYLNQPKPVDQIPGFINGLVSIQDEASQLVTGLLDLAPELNVLDACAAPGGKTCHILESEHSLTSLVAIDREPGRLTKIQENLDRLQLHATLVCADAADPEQWWDGETFDRILLDAPCSATGVIRRHPDIKLLRSIEDVQSLLQQQQGLLESLWPCLKPGGLMLYTTCSVLPRRKRRANLPIPCGSQRR